MWHNRALRRGQIERSIWPIFFVTITGPYCLARAVFFWRDKTMREFRATRVTHEYTQTHDAPPEKVFPLLCPVREADWVPGWQYRVIYSQSGVAESGCVFAIPNEDGSETIWLITEYNAADFHIAFAWVNPGMAAAQIAISLTAGARNTTRAGIRYVYTGLTPEGNKEVARYDEKWFQHKMQSWEAAINHYLRTGKLIEAPTWE